MKLKYSLHLCAWLVTALPVLSQPAPHSPPLYDQDSVLVIYRDGASLQEKQHARALVGGQIQDSNADEKDDRYRHLLQGRVAKFRLQQQSADQAITALKKHPAVLHAEPDYQIRFEALPNDTDLERQWGLDNNGQHFGLAGADIQADEAWDITTGSHEVVVGVIDSGINYRHPDMVDNVWTNPAEIAANGIDDDGNGYIDDVHGINTYYSDGDPMDEYGHGNHVAGIIGATGNNSMGVSGVSQQVSIIGCSFADSLGYGSLSDAIECIDYFVALKAAGVNVRALNNSWGFAASSTALEMAVLATKESGILFVTAAGNDGVDTDVTPFYPASLGIENILNVTGVDRYDNNAEFNYGLTSVDMGAPGSQIYSTSFDALYNTKNGTSMAAPFVTGAAALVWAAYPGLDATAMKELLMTSGDANAWLGGNSVSGRRLNVARALGTASGAPGYTLDVISAAPRAAIGATSSFDVQLNAVNGWTGDVDLSLDSPVPGTTMSANRLAAGDVVTVTVPYLDPEHWGMIPVAVEGHDGSQVVQAKTTATLVPQDLYSLSYSEFPGLRIPGSSVIRVPVDPPLDQQGFEVFVFVDLEYAWVWAIDVTLTSPAGTQVVLHNRGGKWEDIYLFSGYVPEAYHGEYIEGDWTLSVDAPTGIGSGTLWAWYLDFNVTEIEQKLGDLLSAHIARYFHSGRDVLRAELNWSGASGALVELYRNGSRVARIRNNGTFVDVVRRASARASRYVYQICDSSGACSAEMVISLP